MRRGYAAGPEDAISAATREDHRIALVEDVLDSLDRADPDIDKLWAREASDRMAAYRLGELVAKYPK